MTPEEKQLLLKDICARLAHGVICRNCRNMFDVSSNLLPNVDGIKQLIEEFELKPYLRPMSSMTDEENNNFPLPYGFDSFSTYSELITCDYCPENTNIAIDFGEITAVVDWFNQHHFDYRGLIEKGLALEAPEGMYN